MKSKNVSRIKFGLSRIVALFMAAAMLTLGFASCSSDSGDGGDEAKTYFVKVEKAEHGTVVASAEKAEAGKTITLVATAEEGYVFEAYSVKDADGKSVEVKDGAFKMPASDVIVSVSFKEKETTPDTPTDTTKPADSTTNKAAADAVTAKISAIGTVAYTAESKAKIDAARTAYDALTEAQKNLVTNYATLTSAESTYASWTNAGGITVTISPNPAIAITKSDADGSITLTASTGFTGYSWLINGKSAASVAAASVSSDGTVLTLTKAQLSDEVAYQVALNAAKNGITYGAQITVSK